MRGENLVPNANVVYLSDLINLTDFTLFANSGWDGGWFIGYSKSWIQEIRIPQQSGFFKAFAGVKLGRMKTAPIENKPEWESEAIPGKIYISISSTSSLKNAQKFYVTHTKDIPYEGLPEVALNHAGESRWFWVEIPLDLINFEGKNYLAVWSSSKKLKSVESSPIIAAGYDLKDKQKNTWLYPEAKGNLPETVHTETKSISYFEPAIAIKLVPHNAYKVIVSLQNITPDDSDLGKLLFSATVTGVNIEKVWLETSINGKHWERYNRYVYNIPFIFTLDPLTLPKNQFYVRAAAIDEFGNLGYSISTQLLNK